MGKPAGADPRVADAWRDHRQRLMDVAYRMLGSVSDAEDVVQEAYARLVRHGVDGIDDVRGWLVTVASRLCLDQLRSAASRRTSYVGPWLPEPVVDFPSLGANPADRVTLDDSVRMALLVVLEQLSPAERTAFVLHDVFQMSFDEIASIVGRSPAAVRQLASRARRHVRAEAEPPRFRADLDEQRRLAEQFAAAATGGNLAALLEVLDPDVVGDADSGGLVPGAPQHPVVGRDAVARNLLRRVAGRGLEFRPA
ncbi:MAG TPA: RNA polymerase sigma factor SigJ, partial [Acidimicrobiia bacterium]|nr:RNA polymerase sigma factor SigJ [Acidimicrobiia bacterium]